MEDWNMNDNYSDLDHGYRGIFDVTMKEMMGGSGTRENQCINYVVEMYLKMIYQFSEAIFFYNHIENLPDKILDYLAIEWDLPYYEDSLDRDTKVRLVKEGFNWRRTAGTVYGVETLVKKMFGEGKVKEWYAFGGEPGTFRVQTNAPLVPDMEEFFKVLLRKEKNATSWLEFVDIIRDLTAKYYLMGISHQRYSYTKHRLITE